jgi:hypothetical protein
MNKAKAHIKRMLIWDFELKLLFSKASSITFSLVRLARYPKLKKSEPKTENTIFMCLRNFKAIEK